MLKVAYSAIYKYKLPEGHRFPMEKYELLPEQLIYEGTLTESNFFHPEKLSEADILLTHDKSYWEKLKLLDISRKEERKIGFPMRSDLVERGRYIAQGTYMCAKFAKSFGVALNIAGGTHHAYPDHGEGFCVFNDVAIATNLMLQKKEASRILIIDLDVHQGNGNAYIFQSNPNVFTFSFHGAKNYPLRKEISDFDLALDDGTDGKYYLQQLDYHLKQKIDEFQPDFAFYISGVDVLEADRLGRLALSLEACKKRDQMVLSVCRSYQIPLAIAMGGGYAREIKYIIEAHANTYRAVQEIYF